MIAGFAEEFVFLIEDPRHTARHACSEVDAGIAENSDNAAGHVLATVVANALDNSYRAGVANSKALACASRSEQSAPGSTVEGHVAEDHMPLALTRSATLSAKDKFAAAEAFADEIIGKTFEFECHAGSGEGSE